MTATRGPTKEELSEATKRKPIYKVVRVEKNKLLSLWVRGTVRRPVISTDKHGSSFKGTTITYGKGKLSGDGLYGIFCNDTLRSARHQMYANGRGNRCRIYEAYPIGREILNNSGYGLHGTVLYPAIILGSRALVTEQVRYGRKDTHY